MQFSRNIWLTTYQFFLRIMQLTSMQCLVFKLPSITLSQSNNNCNNVAPPVCTVFVILCWHSKNEISGAALELWQSQIEQFSPGILSTQSTKISSPLTLNCSKVSRTFLFIFYAGLSSKNFLNSSYKEKNGCFSPCFQSTFPFLMTMVMETVLATTCLKGIVNAQQGADEMADRFE